MPDVKIVGTSAAAAFVISLISGIIGGVGFLTILFRAVLGGVAFAVLSGGIYMLLEHMVPELFTSTEEADPEVAEEGEPAQSGGNLDITVGDDEEVPSQAAEFSTEGENSEPSEDEGEGSQEDFVEEVKEEEGEEIASDEGEPHKTVPAAADQDDSEGLEDAEQVDTLPDLEDFAESFEGVAASQEEGGSSGETSGRSSASSSAVDVMGDQHDPETVAKAVRTLMKKDQEG